MVRKSGIQLSVAAGRKVGKATKTRATKFETPARASAGNLAAKAKGGRWPVHPQNPFGRPSSAYHVCFNILASHAEGLPRERLVQLLAKATGSDLVHARYNAQVVCSAQKNREGDGVDPFQGPRNRSCRFGFYIERQNSHIKLVLPAAGTASKETP